jgi:hypothetical protein
MKTSDSDLAIKRLEEIKAKSNPMGAKNTQKVIDFIRNKNGSTNDRSKRGKKKKI